jgi:hypothetical protein
MKLEYINEFVSLLAISAQSKIDSEDSQLGSISRRLLRWMWRTAETLPKQQADRLTGIASGQVVPIVMQMYATDSAGSREIVESVLNRSSMRRSKHGRE